VECEPRQSRTGGFSDSEIDHDIASGIGKCFQFRRDCEPVRHCATTGCIDHCHELHVLGRSDGVAHGRAHAPVCTDNSYANHVIDRSRFEQKSQSRFPVLALSNLNRALRPHVSAVATCLTSRSEVTEVATQLGIELIFERDSDCVARGAR